MKLFELFRNKITSAALIFDKGELVIITSDGKPGQVISAPDAQGSYEVKLKNGEIRSVFSTDLELANK